MSLGGRTFRAFRPSQFARQDDLEENGGQAKQAMILFYRQRAEAGQPLFESVSVVKALGRDETRPAAGA